MQQILSKLNIVSIACLGLTLLSIALSVKKRRVIEVAYYLAMINMISQSVLCFENEFTENQYFFLTIVVLQALLMHHVSGSLDKNSQGSLSRSEVHELNSILIQSESSAKLSEKINTAVEVIQDENLALVVDDEDINVIVVRN